MKIYAGVLEVEVANGADCPDAITSQVYDNFRLRLDAFAQANDALIQADYQRLGFEAKHITVDFE